MTRDSSNQSSCSPAKRARLTTTSREREYASTTRSNGTSFMDSWEGPSSSGLQLQEAVNQWEDDVVKIKTLFPTLEEEVLKSYLEIYDIDECIQVVSNLVHGYEDGLDDLGILNETSRYHPENDNSLATNTANAKKEKTKPVSEKRKAENAPSYEDILARISEVKSSSGKSKTNSSKVKTSITGHSNPQRVSSTCTTTRNKSPKSTTTTSCSSISTKPSYSFTVEQSPVKRKGPVRNLSFSSSSSSHTDPVSHVVTSKAEQTSIQTAKHDPKTTASITKDSFTAALEKAISPPKIPGNSQSDSTAPVSICWEDLTLPKHKELKCNIKIAISSKVQNTSTNNTSNSVSSPSSAVLSPSDKVLTAQPKQPIPAAIARQTGQKTLKVNAALSAQPDQKKLNTNHAMKSSLSTGNSMSPAKKTMLPNKTVKTPTKKTAPVCKTAEPEKKINFTSSENQSVGSNVRYKRLQYFTDQDQHCVPAKAPNSISIVITKATKTSSSTTVTPKATYKGSTTESLGIDIRCGKNKPYPLQKSYDREIAKPYVPPTSNYAKSSSSLVSTSVAGTSSLSSSVTTPSIQVPFPVTILSSQSHTNSTLAASKHGTVAKPTQNRQGSSPTTNPLSNQNNQSSFLSSFTEGIKDMNNELQSMLTSVMAKNNKLSTLCQEYSGTPSPGTPIPRTPQPGTPGMPRTGMVTPGTSSSDLSYDDERSRQEMLSLQKETEVLSKLFPEFDPNYIFYELEQHKDDPSRVTKVNEALLKKKGKNERSRRRSNSWLWFDEKTKKFNSFTDGESNRIEMHYNKRNSENIASFAFEGSRKMSFDFRNMTMKDTFTNRTVKIKRVSSTASPAKSSQTGNQNLDEKCLVEVFPGTSEFAKVEGRLKKTIRQAHVVKIEKVNNSLLQRKYYMHYDLLKQKNGEANVNDKELFHGTRGTKPSEIWNSEAGFDMRYSAQGMWGKGCYFAVNAAYSHTYAHVTQGENGQIVRQMFLAQVLTGDAADLPSDRNIIKPPHNETTRREYDSVTGVTFGHRIYVLYNNAMSYPAYLITYTVPQ